MTASANGRDILNAVITEPRVGGWNVELDVDSDEAFSGPVTITVDGVQWKGAAVRGDTYAGRTHARMVGGAGKLATVLDAKHYINPTLYTVLADIAMGAGETLSENCDPALRSRVVSRYVRTRSSAGLQLKELAEQAGMSWRVLRDGTVWVGNPDWERVTPQYDETDKAPSIGLMVIAPDAPSVEPGKTFAGKRVSRVVTRVAAAGLRQEITFDDGDGSSQYSRGVADVVAVVEAIVGPRFDYSRMYACRVVNQAGDGTLELLPDHPKVRGTGTTHVPIRHGIPGVNVKVPAGGRVLLFWEDGDRTKPAAALWPDGSSVTELKITAPTVIIDGDLQVTGEVTSGTGNPATSVTLTHHTHPTAMGPSSEPTPGT